MGLLLILADAPARLAPVK